MGHSKAERTKTHRRVVALASKSFREKGLAGVGIAELMKKAGLTVGGFYKHFRSRNDLVAEALGNALGRWQHRVAATESGGPPFTYEMLIDDYLTESHRDGPGDGCPVGALAGDVARSGKQARAILSGQILEDIELLATLIHKSRGKDSSSARSKAVVVYCALVGAIGIARAIPDKRFSRDILKTVESGLKKFD